MDLEAVELYGKTLVDDSPDDLWGRKAYAVSTGASGSSRGGTGAVSIRAGRLRRASGLRVGVGARAGGGRIRATRAASAASALAAAGRRAGVGVGAGARAGAGAGAGVVAVTVGVGGRALGAGLQGDVDDGRAVLIGAGLGRAVADTEAVVLLLAETLVVVLGAAQFGGLVIHVGDAHLLGIIIS